MIDQDKKTFEYLRKYLREAEQGIGISVTNSTNTVISQAETLVKKIPLQIYGVQY